MKIVFFGTPDYVVPILSSIHKKFIGKAGKSPIVAVVTQGPKEVGRKKTLTFSPVDKWAHERNIPTYYSCEKLIDDKIEADLGILAAYGEIIPKSVLYMFKNGILNIHPSSLPEFRGASPVQGTIASGKNQTAGTIIRLDEKMDHGPIVVQFKEDVLPNDTTESLRNRIFDRSREVMTELVQPYIAGKIKLKPQDHEKATYTKLLKKEFGFIPSKYINDALNGESTNVDWEIPFVNSLVLKPTAKNIDDFVRSLSPWPGAWTYINIKKNTKKRMKILKAHVFGENLILDEVQLEGKNPVSWDLVKKAYPESNLEE